MQILFSRKSSMEQLIDREKKVGSNLRIRLNHCEIISWWDNIKLVILYTFLNSNKSSVHLPILTYWEFFLRF